ncbi:Vacuolar protein sorting-associated protein 62 [Melia azedarach]|nr:Vacuolar protein sorting-associated protein 62 [Melia azedarach]
MFSCDCLCWNRDTEFEFGFDFHTPHPEPFSLPSPLPQWPQGKGFATGRINLGELEVIKIAKFDRIWSCNVLHGKAKGVAFYKPVEIPDGFYCLGHYCQPNDQPLRGYVLVARDAAASRRGAGSGDNSLLDLPALKMPLNYTLVWSTDPHYGNCSYFWQPNPPVGYKAMGIVVTNTPEEPEVDEVRCVREDLTESCETCHVLLSTDASLTFEVWSTRPCRRGMFARGVSVGTFFCGTYLSSEERQGIACLKNLDSTLDAMPNLDQIHALIKHYGPTVFFHPNEEYLPSSVQWFFKNGAVLYEEGKLKGEPIDYRGSNLPCGGSNDGAFWIDLPDTDEARDFLMKGNLESAELYVHVKPAVGGTFTDIAMWIFCPFNGPATLKIGLMSIAMTKIGQHVSDWEHFTLRVSNFTGELWQVYFSEHSGGRWLNASDLEFIEGNKPIVYSSKHGHASFPHPGTYLQGSSKLGIGVRNDAAQSKFFVDSSTKYQIIAAEYLGDGVVKEPCWLQYMREWGPTIVYDSRSELDKIINLLPLFVRFSVENIFDLFPTELYGEEGPTGPKEKDNWEGDERC